MLHYETIDSTTLELLKKLQRIKEFSKLRLVGGTSLALQLGHRKSIGLDLFGLLGTDEHELRDILKTIGSISILPPQLPLINPATEFIPDRAYCFVDAAWSTDIIPRRGWRVR